MLGDLRSVRLFAETFGEAPDHLGRAPGRVNLMGDHTDYNDGFVLPMALDRSTWIAFKPRRGRRVRVASEGYPAAEFDLDDLDRSGPSWLRYVTGVAWSIGADDLAGWDGALATDVPIGAALSSSAALEIAVALAFAQASEIEWVPERMAIAAQRAEAEWVGMECGIMDQLAAACSVADHALFIDCRTLEASPIPMPTGVSTVVLDTGTRRELVDSAYNERRATCSRVAADRNVPALRDLEESDLAAIEDDNDRKRARHVVTENARATAAAAAMTEGDSQALGALMVESHASLRDDFEVSSPALDAMVDSALTTPGCRGARMTGAGFAGCAVALVDTEVLADFIPAALDRYEDVAGRRGAAYPSRPGDGASLQPWRQL